MSQYRITMENLRYDPIRDKPYGDGTVNSPYKISSAENLIYLAEHEEMWDDKHFLQTNNIDMSGIDWKYQIQLVNSEYNGNSYYIENLNIVIDTNIDPYSYGLFATMNYGSVLNLTIKDSYFLNNTGIRDYFNFGFICGNIQYSSEVINCVVDSCYIDNRQTGWAVGAICGTIAAECNITACVSSNNDIIGYNLTGGITGYMFVRGAVFGCVSKNNNIKSINNQGDLSIGGICGFSHSNCIVNNCYSLQNSIVIESIYSPNQINAGGINGVTVENAFEYNNWSNSNITDNTLGAINTYIGGVSGRNTNPDSLSASSYWDSESTGILQSDYLNPSGIKANAITTAELAQQSTFTDWDFTDIWEMETNYPILQFESFIIEKETEVFEYNFPYPIIANTTKYDPFSYISYDYMVSTSRRAEFEALVLDYFDEENYDFVNSLMRVGYSVYDNDITLYNHFYYDTEEDESVLIELDDVTIKYDVGEKILDKYGEQRVVSSREIVTEGVSTVMCRIYEKVKKDEEVLVYSGLIDKRNTSFDGRKMRVSLVDIMGLYVELSEKYNVVVNDFQNTGFDAVSPSSKIRGFVSFLQENLNIDNKYLPNVGEIAPNLSGINSFTENFSSSSKLLSTRNVDASITSLSGYGGGSRVLIFFLPVIVTFDIFGDISLSQIDYSAISSNDDIGFNPTNFAEDSGIMLNVSNLRLYRNKYETRNDELTIREFDSYKEKYGAVINIRMALESVAYSTSSVGNKLSIFPNLGILTEDSYAGHRVAFAKYNKNKIKAIDTNLNGFDYTFAEDFEDFYLDLRDKLQTDEVNSAIASELKAFEDEINTKLNNDVIFLNCSEYPTNGEEMNYSDYVSIYESLEDNDFNYLVKIQSQPRISKDGYVNNDRLNCTEPILYTDTYVNTIPLYSNTYSLYDMTKLFSLIGYNRILTKNTGEMYFDAETYDASGYIKLNYNDIYDKYSQSSMIGDDEEFSVLDNVYIGQKYIKEAYKRLESSTKENYKKLYENNNTKISMRIDNIDYDIYSNKDSLIGNRKLSVNDEVRIMKNNSVVLLRFFVTSIKYANDGYFIDIEGITMTDSNEGGGLVEPN